MRRVTGNALALVFGIFLALCAMEAVARFIVPAPDFIMRDPYVGRRLMPHTERLSTGPGWEGRSRTNADGWNSPEIPRNKPEGTYRIAHIGDSQTEGMYVDTDRNFVTRTMAEIPGTDGLNMGVGGLGTYPELLMYRHHARAYAPDLTFLWFNPGNDFRDNLLVRHVVGSGATVPDLAPPAQAWLKTALLQHLRLPRLLYDRFHTNRLFTTLLIKAGLLAMEPEEFAEEIPLSYRTLVIDTPERAAAAAVTRHLLEAFAREVDTGELVVGVIPSYVEAGPRAVAEFRALYPAAADLQVDRDFGSRTLRQLGRELGIPVLDLTPAFRAAYARGETPHIPNEGHLSLQGHDLMVREIAAFLRKTGRVR